MSRIQISLLDLFVIPIFAAPFFIAGAYPNGWDSFLHRVDGVMRLLCLAVPLIVMYVEYRVRSVDEKWRNALAAVGCVFLGISGVFAISPPRYEIGKWILALVIFSVSVGMLVLVTVNAIKGWRRAR